MFKHFFEAFLAFLKASVKHQADQEINALAANRDALLAEAAAAGVPAEQFVENAIVNALKSNAHLAPFVALVQPEIHGVLAAEAAAGANDAPKLFDAAIAFLRKEENYL